MAGLVRDRHLRRLRAARREPAGAAGEERRVLHAVGLALEGRVDDRHVAVGIRAEPLAVALQRRLGGGEVAIGLAAVLGPQQQAHLDRRQRRVRERPRRGRCSRGSPSTRSRGRPRRDSDASSMPSALSVRAVCRPVAPTTNGRGDGDAHVVDAEVGVELGGRVELVRVPARILEHAQLREPLGDEVVVADVAGARERPRDLGRPLDLDLDRLVRLDRCVRAARPSPCGRARCRRQAR